MMELSTTLDEWRNRFGLCKPAGLEPKFYIFNLLTHMILRANYF